MSKRFYSALVVLGVFAIAHRFVPESSPSAAAAPAAQTSAPAAAAVAKRSLASVGPILDEDADGADSARDLDRRDFNWRNADGEIEFAALVGPYSNAEAAPVDRFIALATESVDIEIYEMDDPAVRAALRAALARHVRVRVIKDPKPIGDNCDSWGDSSDPKFSAVCRDGQALGREIAAAGGRFEKFALGLCGQRAGTRGRRCYQHGKSIVVDGRLALVSTGNFNSSNLCDRAANPSVCNRDYTYVTRDRAVISALSKIFDRDLTGAWHDPRTAVAEAHAERKLTVSPFSFEPLRDFLNSATRTIQIQNQYINPDSNLVEILTAKARTGRVRVEIQLADFCAHGRPRESRSLVQKRLMFQELESAGAVVRIFPREHRVGDHQGYLHAKAIVIDGERAWIGSVNGSAGSLNKNREFGVFFSHPTRVAGLARFMAQDFANPASLTWQESFDCRRLGTGADQRTDQRPSSPKPEAQIGAPRMNDDEEDD